MKLLSIDHPCHENWHTMNASEQGAFCNSCQKHVIDFTAKTNAEIVDFLKSHTGESHCGRFNTSQYQALNTDYTDWENQRPEIFQSKFLMALFLVFGFTLFSCKTGEELPFETEYLAEMITQDSLSTVTTAATNDSLSATEITPADSSFSVIENPPFDTETGVIAPGKIEITAIDFPYILGCFIGPHCFPIEPPICIAEEQKSLVLDFQLPVNELEANLNPYPFEIELTELNAPVISHQLTITNSALAYTTIFVRDQNGKEIQSLCADFLEAGHHYFNIELSGYIPGIYFICIQQGEFQLIEPIQIPGNPVN